MSYEYSTRLETNSMSGDAEVETVLAEAYDLLRAGDREEGFLKLREAAGMSPNAVARQNIGFMYADGGDCCKAMRFLDPVAFVNASDSNHEITDILNVVYPRCSTEIATDMWCKAGNFAYKHTIPLIVSGVVILGSGILVGMAKKGRK